MKMTAYILLGFAVLTLSAGAACADTVNQGRAPLDRDTTYEQDLRWENSADKTVTPAKVIRWMMGMRGSQINPPGPTEFQPIVNAHDGQLRVVAALAYKF
jgi:hypothetical protein